MTERHTAEQPMQVAGQAGHPLHLGRKAEELSYIPSWNGRIFTQGGPEFT